MPGPSADDTHNLVAPIGWRPAKSSGGNNYKRPAFSRSNTPLLSFFSFSSSSSSASSSSASASAPPLVLSQTSPTEKKPIWAILKSLILSLLWAGAVIGIFVVVILAVFWSGNERHRPVFLAGLVLVAPACLLSFFLIGRHLTNFVCPLQRYVVRILWMVPIYGINACLSLMYADPTPYLDACREFYEAYVIYNFLRLLEDFLGGEARINLLLESKTAQKHLFPFRCVLKTWDQSVFLHRCHVGVLQFVVVRCAVASITFIIHTGFQLFSYGNFGGSSAYLYLILTTNVSQVWALYCLVLFYLTFSEELSPLRPLLKFMSLKWLIFMTFWQAVLLAALVQAGVVHSVLSFSTEEVARGLQNLLVCAEMFIAAVAHHWAFPPSDFVGNPAVDQSPPPPPYVAFLQATDPRDLADDVVKAHSAWRVIRSGGGPTEVTDDL